MHTIRVGLSIELAVLAGCASENSDARWTSLMMEGGRAAHLL